MAKGKEKVSAPKVEEVISASVEETSSDPVVVEKKVSAPKVELPKTELKPVAKTEKVKFIKDMPRLYIGGQYYEGTKGEDRIVPGFVAFILRGSANKTEVFAV